ncbi:MAG TPA: amidohydrolase family protein [Opitutaceae bacterium]|nr:amidohydrolase family protein [Opitutaceae bacterium]
MNPALTRREFNRRLLLLAGAAVLPAPLFAEARNPSSPITAVDTHAHLFERRLKFASVHRYLPDYDATLAMYLRLLDAHGISNGVLIQPSFLGTDNSYLLQALQSQRSRLRGIVVVDPSLELDQLRALDESGAVGIRLNLIGLPLPELRRPPWQAFLRRLQSIDWIVQVQREARDMPAIVDPLLDAGLRVVIDHFGRPDPAAGVNDPGFRYLLQRGATGRVWMKLSGAYRNGGNRRGEAIAAAAMPLLRQAYGLDHLVWGSDWPHTQFEHVTDYSHARALLDRWIPDPVERQVVLRDTPARLYRFEPAARASS